MRFGDFYFQLSRAWNLLFLFLIGLKKMRRIRSALLEALPFRDFNFISFYIQDELETYGSKKITNNLGSASQWKKIKQG